MNQILQKKNYLLIFKNLKKQLEMLKGIIHNIKLEKHYGKFMIVKIYYQKEQMKNL